jgi:hypothetical protein
VNTHAPAVHPSKAESSKSHIPAKRYASKSTDVENKVTKSRKTSTAPKTLFAKHVSNAGDRASNKKSGPVSSFRYVKPEDIIVIEDDEATPVAQEAAPITLPYDPIDDYAIKPIGIDRYFLTYPYTTKKSVMVNAHDFKKLEKGTYLNDSLIDIFPKIWSNKLNALIYTYSSFFYTKFSGSNFNHETVKRWTSKEDIFKKQLLVIPIHRKQHWLVILVVNSGFCIKGDKEKEYQPNIIINDEE